MISLAQFGCKKSGCLEPAPTSLNGKWRMIAVKDNASGLTTTKPVSIQNDVDITFTSINSAGGTFTGNTPTNQIWQNEYSTGANQTLTIPALGMTKAWETSWGSLFVNNIRSSRDYTFEAGGLLNINTDANTLIFRKQ